MCRKRCEGRVVEVEKFFFFSENTAYERTYTLVRSEMCTRATVNTGALPILFAATAPGLPNNSYVGPEDKWQTRGYPTLVDRDESATDALEARRLWDWSEEITGVGYPF